MIIKLWKKYKHTGSLGHFTITSPYADKSASGTPSFIKKETAGKPAGEPLLRLAPALPSGGGELRVLILEMAPNSIPSTQQGCVCGALLTVSQYKVLQNLLVVPRRHIKHVSAGLIGRFDCAMLIKPTRSPSTRHKTGCV